MARTRAILSETDDVEALGWEQIEQENIDCERKANKGVLETIAGPVILYGIFACWVLGLGYWIWSLMV